MQLPAATAAQARKTGAKPRRIASLYVGPREGNRLLYAGKVPSGYTEAVARDLRERLDSFIRKVSPLSEPIKKPKSDLGRAGDRGRDRLQHGDGKQSAARSRVQGPARSESRPSNARHVAAISAWLSACLAFLTSHGAA
jgi:hypothetical protein